MVIARISLIVSELAPLSVMRGEERVSVALLALTDDDASIRCGPGERPL